MSAIKPPLTWAAGSVVYADGLGDPWALFTIPTASYDTQPKAEQLSVQGDIEQVLIDIGRDGQIVSLARTWDSDAYVADRRGRRSPLRELRDQYVAEQEAELVGAIPASPPRVFMALSLRDPAIYDTGTDLARLGPLQRIRENLSATGRMIASGVLPERKREEDQREATALLAQLQGVSAFQDAEPATIEDVQWWLRHCWARGLGEPDVDAGDEPQAVLLERNGQAAVQPLELDMLRWTGGITTAANHLVVDGPQGRTVQVGMLATQVTGTAERTHPKLALAFAPRTWLAWPVDLAISWHWVDNKASFKKVAGKEKEVRDDALEAHQSEGGATDKELIRPGVAADLSSRLDMGEEPTLHATISAIVSHPIADEIGDSRADAAVLRDGVREARAMAAETIKAWKKRADVRFHIPPLQQLEVFFGQLPGQRPTLPGYRRILMPDQVAAQAWLAAEQVGSRTGWLLGHTSSLRPVPVRLDPRDGSEENTAPGMLFLGQLGSGKTVATGKVMLEAILDGGIVIDVDPKGDHTWFEALPEDAHQLVTLSAHNDAHRGLLDPFISAPEEIRVTVAQSFLNALLPEGADARWRVRLREAVSLVAERGGTEACCSEVIRVLHQTAGENGRQDPDAAEVARSLAAIAKQGIVRLGFADVGRAATLGQRRATILATNFLPRPDARRDRREFSEADRYGEQISLLLSQFAYRTMARHRAELKIFNNDEGWRDLNTESGREVFNAMQRMGRSELVVPIVGSQLATDIATDTDQIENLFGLRIAFRQADEQQAARALELMGLDPDPRLIRELTRKFTKAQQLAHGARALMRDHRGRTGWVHVRVAPMQQRSFTSPDVEATRARDEIHESESDAIYAG